MPLKMEVEPEHATQEDKAGAKGAASVPGSPLSGEGQVKTRRWGLLLIAAVIVAAGALLVWRHYAGWVSTDDAEIEAHLHPVSARISGHVIKVMVDNTDYVEKGAVLVELDPRITGRPSTKRGGSLPMRVRRRVRRRWASPSPR